MTNETRLLLEKKQAQFLREIKIEEKKLKNRLPKKEKADRDLADKKRAAIQRVEELHLRNNRRLNEETKVIEEKLALKRKGYLEISADILRAIPSGAVTVPVATRGITGTHGATNGVTR